MEVYDTICIEYKSFSEIKSYVYIPPNTPGYSNGFIVFYSIRFNHKKISYKTLTNILKNKNIYFRFIGKEEIKSGPLTKKEFKKWLEKHNLI